MDFEALKDLVNIITRNKVKQIEILGSAGNDDNRLNALYDLIAEGKVSSDEDAAMELYETSNPKDVNYKRLRNRLVRQLINSAFFIDLNQPMFNERTKAHHNCYRDFAAANIFMVRQAPKAAVYILHQTLEQAEKYEFIDLAADVCKLLKMNYSRTEGDRSNHEHFVKLHRKYEEKRRQELLAFDYYDNLLDYYIVKQSPNEEIKKLAGEYFEELKALAPTANTSQFYFYTYMTGLIRCFAANDAQNASIICDEALETLKNKPNSNRSYLSGFYMQKILCLIQLRIFENDEGSDVFLQALQLEEPGNFNWFRLKELRFQYLIYLKRYEQALEVYTEALQQERYVLLGPNVRDRWALMGGYLHVLALLGQIDGARVEAVAGPYRYGRLNNSIEVLDKDKEGMNIPLVLLPFIYSIASGETYHDEGGRSIDALEKYRRRYLDNALNKRSDLFMSILMGCNRLPDDAAMYKKKIAKRVEELLKTPQQVSGQSVMVEIIPYEDLWEMIQKKVGI